jgi:dolichol-phosphate mannosyltransferase
VPLHGRAVRLHRKQLSQPYGGAGYGTVIEFYVINMKQTGSTGKDQLMPRDSNQLPIELSIVVPTFNEKDNVEKLIEGIEQVLPNVKWEIVFIDDDSPDGTADFVRNLAQSKPYVRCHQRIGRRGLSRAVIEGMLSSSAPVIVVMDADLQHDETILPAMLDQIRDNQTDIVVGSRYCSGGSMGAWNSQRAAMSRFATLLSRTIVTPRLTDPMSGFFMIQRETFHRIVRRLSGEGYKILLDLIASSPEPLRLVEVPYTFRERVAGESKLDSAVIWEYLLLIADKKFGHILPARFILFSLVGLSGVGVHFVVLAITFKALGLQFSVSQTIATLSAMTSNFVLNNILTYRDMRLRGRKFLSGLFTFYLVCGIGVIANVGIANFVFQRDYTWWLAGGAGALVGTVWNYAASSILTWGRK